MFMLDDIAHWRQQCHNSKSVFFFQERHLTLNLPTTTIVAQPFNIIKWQLKFNPVA